jgi:hypothetical protein
MGRVARPEFIRISTSQPTPVLLPQLTGYAVSAGLLGTGEPERDSGMSYCWCHNQEGGIGDGTTTTRTTPGMEQVGSTWRRQLHGSIDADVRETITVIHRRTLDVDTDDVGNGELPLPNVVCRIELQ